MCCSHLFNDPLLQQALLLGSHDEVVGGVFVVDNVLQINTWSVKWRESMLGLERDNVGESDASLASLKGTYHAKCTFVRLLYMNMCQKTQPSLFSSIPKSLKKGLQRI